MRLFLILCSLAALAQAKPQGYNYGSGISGSLSGGGGGSGISFTGGLSGGSSGGGGGGGGSGIGFSGGLAGLAAPSGGFHSGGSSFGGYQSSSSNLGGFQSSGSSGFHSSGGGGGGSGFQSGGGLGGASNAGGFESALVHKQFITISAPEDHDALEQSKHFVIGRPQKNYRVVFIKAPSSSAANVKLSAEYAPQEEKTVIYVLTKKDSSLEVNDIATPAPTVPTKPEVFFIKYKTDAEAQHAQRQIQAEYDKIEGTSEHSDGGVGQQQSVVGILDGGAGGGGGAGSAGSTGGSFGIGGSGVGSGQFGSSSGTFGTGSGSSGSNLGAKSPTYLPPAHVLKK